MANKYDKVLSEYREDDATRALKLDQSTPETVTGGAPIFDQGIVSNGPIRLRSGQRLILDA